MIKALSKIFRSDKAAKPLPSVPEGERYYVVGDIHGRCDLFDALAKAIEADEAGIEAKSTVILLGDLVDRGPDSAGVIAAAREWQTRRPMRFLAGNHEEMFLESFDDRKVLRHFVKHGGRETIMSYGLTRKQYDALELQELQDEMQRLVPREHRDFLESFEDMIVIGDYVFVHAGIDPARPIEDQSRSDLRWIRERFLNTVGPLSHVVVHGHTIFEDVEDKGHRIGIDTGAFRTGVLTALVLEGTERRYIQAVERDGTITIQHG
ncbi:MAG: serine/threonine protein phosphatase [Erythrobacter sp.]|nr:serine/threonine protein phosphatase [Erythrobacter sp.]